MGEEVRYRKASIPGKFIMASNMQLLIFLLLALFLSSCGRDSQQIRLEVREGESYSIVELGRYLASREVEGASFSAGDLAAIDLLKEIAGTDPVISNRMRAISALAGCGNVNSTKVFVSGLNSKYWGVRWESTKALTARPDPEAVGALVSILQFEKETIILLDAVKALAAIGDEPSLKALFSVYFDLTPRHMNNRMKAYTAICQITGKNLPLEDAHGWLKYSRERFAEKPQDEVEGKE